MVELSRKLSQLLRAIKEKRERKNASDAYKHGFCTAKRIDEPTRFEIQDFKDMDKGCSGN